VKAPLKLLVAAADEAARRALSADAAAAGMSVIGATDCSSLVRGVPDLEPDCVVMRIARPDAPLFTDLAD